MNSIVPITFVVIALFALGIALVCRAIRNERDRELLEEDAAEPQAALDAGEPLTLNEIVALAYANAVDKGFHNEPKSFGDDMALIHSEVSEALEAYRMVGVNGVASNMPRTPKGKPEGVPSELADVVIRIADVCGKYRIDLDAAVAEKLTYNASRPYRHGGKHL